MSCCGHFDSYGRAEGFVHDYYGLRFRGYGRIRNEFDGCREVTPCCPPAVETVNCVINGPECHGVVRLHITGRFSNLTNRCFKLLLCQNSLQNINTKPVYLVDGERALPLIQAHTGNIVHYDQMCELVDFHKRRWAKWDEAAKHRRGYGYGYFWNEHRHMGPREIALDCFIGLDGPAENGIHVLVRTRLPKTTFTPLPDIAGPVEGGEPYQGPIIDS